MCAISFSFFKEPRVAHIFLNILVLCNDIKNVFRGEAFPNREKNNKIFV